MTYLKSMFTGLSMMEFLKMDIRKDRELCTFIIRKNILDNSIKILFMVKESILRIQLKL